MPDRAAVLVHGATGFTGALVCRALADKRIPFAISGRSADKLASLAGSLGGEVERCVVDLASPDTIRAAVEGRRVVCACAGPFLEVGEPILAFCARAGVHYADTTGEQAFVARMAARYRATAEASGACVVPAMAYEIAIADWGAHLAADKLGGKADRLDICYGLKTPGGPFASRGTQLSAVAQFASGDAQQFVDGKLVPEATGAKVRAFDLESLDGGPRKRQAISFPGPEAIVVPSHTGALTVRTFMPVAPFAAKVVHAAPFVLPLAARSAAWAARRLIARGPAGPDAGARARTLFEIVVEAERAGARATVRLTGRDPYGLTGTIQALFARKAVEGAVRAKGVVAPSVALDPSSSLTELQGAGVAVS